MCDYSLHGIRNRLAEKGEVLVVHRFSTGSKGLTSPELLSRPKSKGLLAFLARKIALAQPEACAVCVPDGAKLMLHDISPLVQQTHGLNTTEAVIFRQLSMEALAHRDAVEFKNGVKLRLQDLEEGQNVEVVALSSEHDVADEKLIPVQT